MDYEDMFGFVTVIYLNTHHQLVMLRTICVHSSVTT